MPAVGRRQVDRRPNAKQLVAIQRFDGDPLPHPPQRRPGRSGGRRKAVLLLVVGRIVEVFEPRRRELGRRPAGDAVAPLAVVVIRQHRAAEVELVLDRIHAAAGDLGQFHPHYFLAAFQDFAQLAQRDRVGEADDGLGGEHGAAPGRIAPSRHGEEDDRGQDQGAQAQHGQPLEQLGDDAGAAAADRSCR